MDRPSHVYVDSNSLWAFYNFVTIALQHSHPKTWMEDQRVLHYFISTVNNFQQCNTPAQIVVPVPTDITANTPVVNPNQVDLEDLIAIAEAEQANRADLEADQIDEDIRYAAQEEEVVSDANQLEDPRDEEADLNDWMNIPLETTPKEDVPPYEPAEDQEYTGENASYMKGSDFDIDKSNEELFAEKVSVIKENYFPSGVKRANEASLHESVEDPDTANNVKISDPRMAAYAQVISRTLAK